ncbi:MAG: ImcF-related family protein [Rouxiella aceris]|uniref:ImcF-related family protein n=1 Tax=Rouxiella aceris TaxID=2703884 RepID=UPI0028521AE9|nr:ImcF-related family protein [Rouxiella aceris]MDR3434204.1 ImcF-related family protein [Rouxiella aceris]
MTKDVNRLLLLLAAVVMALLWLAASRGVIAYPTLWWASGLLLLAYCLLIRFTFVIHFLGFMRVIEQKNVAAEAAFDQLCFQLHQQFGWRWRHTLPWLLITGDAQTVEKLLPGLTTLYWKESPEAILLWCGEATALELSSLSHLRKLRGRHALNAVLWVSDITPQQEWTDPEPAELSLQKQGDQVYQQLAQAAQTLSWRPPVYAICLRNVPGKTMAPGEYQPPAVGCNWPAGVTVDMHQQLQSLVPSLIATGMAQTARNWRDYWLLQLAHDLQYTYGERLAQAITPWLAQQRVLFSGVFFMPLSPLTQRDADPHCLLSPAWGRVITLSRQQSGKRDRPTPTDRLCFAALILAGVWLAGMLISGWNNRQLIIDSRKLQQPARVERVSSSERIAQHLALQDGIDRLTWWQQQGPPWRYRFALSQYQAVLAALWPTWLQYNQAFLVTPIVTRLEQQLQQFADLPANARQGKQGSKQAYRQLKAYLMLIQPQRAETAFLQQVLAPLWPAPSGLSTAEWQSQSARLLAFYLRELPSHQSWRINGDASLIAEVRASLLSQQQESNAVKAIYQQLLRSLAGEYADVTINDLLPGQLLTTQAVVPGIFTRQAWDDKVRTAIEQASVRVQTSNDWVLDDGREPLPALSRQQWQQRLTERYFIDFSSAWRHFLNSLRWQYSTSPSTSLDQLLLWGDTSRSPLLLLGETLRWQAGVGQGNELLAAPLQHNLLQRVAQAPATPARIASHSPAGSVVETFAPLLALLPPVSAENGERTYPQQENALSLTGYLLQVAQAGMQLQQIVTAVDPQSMALTLVQAELAGTETPLRQSRYYAQRLAVSLGEEWAGFTDAVLQQPLQQTWNSLLYPAQQGLNKAWKTQVQVPWQEEFSGRYPFHNTQAETSFVQLAHYLAPDSGLIERFLSRQLAGLLEKQGNSWVPNPLTAEMMRFDPAFLNAINQLSQLGQQAFARGQADIAFELQIKPTQNLLEIDFQLDDARMKYFNQQADWQTFRWPDLQSRHPQIELSFAAVNQAGEQPVPFANYYQAAGNWALLRLLEKAKSEPLSGSRYRLSWTTATGENLTAIMRSNTGAGPLDMLALRRFTLPGQIFMVTPVAQESD